MTSFTKIRFGAGLSVEDEGNGIITVSGGGGGGGGTGPAGPTGATGPPGADGADGVGVPAGGTSGQVLTKDTGTDYDTSWQTPTGGSGGPPTGAAGGVLSGTYPNPGFAADMATQAELDAHTADTSDAHDASAISVADAGSYLTATDVEAALQELAAAAAAGATVLHMVASWAGNVPAVPSFGPVWRVPYLNGSPVTFDLTRAYARVETPGTSAIDVTIDKSAAGGFVASWITTLTIAGAGYEDENTSSLGSVSSGELLRITFPGYPSTTGPYTVELEGTEA